MKSFPTIATIAILFLACFIISCSNNTPSSPATPPLDTSAQLAQKEPVAGAGRYLWAYYEIHADTENNTMSVVPSRQVSGHWNVLTWLEKKPCTNCVKVTSMVKNPQGSYNVDLQIKHPFTNPNYTGFDVRGIAMFNGSHNFPDAGVMMPDHTMGDGELVNADDYTTLYNSTTAGMGPNGQWGYLKGKLASATAPNGTLNGYKRYISTDPANTRNAFYAGESITVTNEVYLPTGKFIFGYAIDASWAPPTNKPVVDPMVDFPPEANCVEPWKVELTEEPSATFTDHGGSEVVRIKTWDYQGKDSYNPPTIECPELYDGTEDSFVNVTGSDYVIYDGVVSNIKLAPTGTYRALVKIKDKDQVFLPIDDTTYAMCTVTVLPVTGWVDTLGGAGSDNAWDIAVDNDNNVYVAGSYTADAGTMIDLDPTSGVDNHMAKGKLDPFLIKLDSSGAYQWCINWGGAEDDYAAAVAVDTDYVYVVGAYQGTADFDPSISPLNKTSNGSKDCFESIFTPDGKLFSNRTWGGNGVDEAVDVAVYNDYSNDNWVTGYFEDTVDFNPYYPVDERTAGMWTPNAFVTKYTAADTYAWTRTWGDTGTGVVFADGVSVFYPGYCSVVGYFKNTVDFDPGAGTTEYTSNGGFDIFLNRLDTDGNFSAARTWGGPDDDYPQSVSATQTSAWVAGQYSGTVDFNPDAGVDNHTSNGGSDAFVSYFEVYSATIIFQYALTWGGTGNDRAMDVRWLNISDYYVVGDFEGTVDFDPGTGNAPYTSKGGLDAYVTRFATDGSHMWTRTVGGVNNDYGYGVAGDSIRNAYLCGSFWGTANFDPEGTSGDKTSNGDYDMFVEKILNDGSW
jgi:hypothetical protein